MKQYEKSNYERDISSSSEENEHSVKHNRLAHLIGRAATAMVNIFEDRKKKQTGVEVVVSRDDPDTSDGLMNLSISVGSDIRHWS